MRGGMRLDVLRNQAAPVGGGSDYKSAWWGQCTNGFNVYDYKQSLELRVVTFGHCTVGDYKIGQTNTYRLDLDATAVGYEVYNFENGGQTGSTYPVVRV